MTVRFRTPNPLRAALEAVRSNPDAVKAIEAEDAATAAAAAKEARRIATLRAKIEAELPERTRQLVEDFEAVEREAIQQAAERLARQQLEARYLANDNPDLAALTRPPARLTERQIAAARDRVARPNLPPAA